MSEPIDYGPLAELIGTWRGDKGMDITPEPDGAEENPYYETITFTPVGDVTNAESQTLVALHYLQVVQRKSNDEVFHHQTGYWMWDAASNTVMQSLTIPRGVCVLAGGSWNGERDEEGRVKIEVIARLGDEDWGVVQSPFMRDNARTGEFTHHLRVGNGRLSYSETTWVDIYDHLFEHKDANELVRVD
jgi:hypothetical protein